MPVPWCLAPFRAKGPLAAKPICLDSTVAAINVMDIEKQFAGCSCPN